MDNYTVSIVVPVYNAEKYIERCVNSILAQTYQDFELLLIDDGSKDGSGVLCDQFAADERVRVIHKENSGVAATRNIGIQEARGTYISFVDSDDYIKSDMLEKLVQRAVKHDSDIVMCPYFIHCGEKISKAQMKYDEVYDGAESVKNGLLYLYYTDCHDGLYSLCNKLIKKSVYKDNRVLFDTTLKRGEDAWFVFQCLKHCKRVDYIPEAFYYYCQNESSIMHTVYGNQYEKWVDMRKRLLKENEELQFNINYDLFYKEFLYKVAVYCRELAKNGDCSKMKQILSDPFYIQAAKWVGVIPLHIKILTKIAKSHMTLFAVILYRLWGIAG